MGSFYWGNGKSYSYLRSTLIWAGKEVTGLLSANSDGQGLVEYALILALVAIVVFAALIVLGPVIGGVFSTLNSSLSGI